MFTRRQAASGLGALALVGRASRGQTVSDTYPTGPIRFVVPLTPGGVGDVIARVVAGRAQAALGQPIVIENRAGGNSVVGTLSVARARPDGYTIMLLSSFGLVVTVLQDNLPYSLERDLTPVVGLGSQPIVLAVPGDSPFHSFQDLVAAARAGGGIMYASGGVGSLGHLAGARLLNSLNVTDGTHVPYRGNNELAQAIVAGQIAFGFPATADVLPFVQSGEVRLLAATSAHRMRILPDVPTMSELGMPEFDPKLWFGVLAPAGTPEPIKGRLEAAFLAAASEPTLRTRLEGLGFDLDGPDGGGLRRLMESERTRWAKVIADNAIKPN